MLKFIFRSKWLLCLTFSLISLAVHAQNFQTIEIDALRDKYGYSPYIESLAYENNKLFVGVGGSNTYGAIHSYLLTGGQWQRQTSILSIQNPSFDLALLGDKLLLKNGWLIAPNTSGYNDCVYIYQNNDVLLQPNGSLCAPQKPVFLLNPSVAMDNNLLFYANPASWRSNSDKGEIGVYQLKKNKWALTTTLKNIANPHAWNFGNSLVAEGGQVIASGIEDGPDTSAGWGVLYVFEHTKNRWTQTAKLSHPKGIRASFGAESLSLSGNTLVATGTEESVDFKKHAYVFEKQQGEWKYQQEIFVPDAMPAPQNWSFYKVSVKNNYLLACLTLLKGDEQALWLYRKTDSIWKPIKKLSNRVNDAYKSGCSPFFIDEEMVMFTAIEKFGFVTELRKHPADVQDEMRKANPGKAGMVFIARLKDIEQ